MLNQKVEVCDFNRSFIRWRIDVDALPPLTVSHEPPFTVNNVRVQLDCRAEITDIKTNQTVEYVLGAACKTERVHVDGDIWTQPNADFNPITGEGKFMPIKRWDKVDKGVMRYPESLGVQPERQVEDVKEAFERFSVDIERVSGTTLETTSEILDTLFSERKVICRTEYGNASTRVLLEYPLKTVNFSECDNYYQADTGPVLLYNLAKDCEETIEKFDMAFIAHNYPDWAEFIVNVPTPIAEGISVHHYSKSERIETKNSLIVIE